jgi:hydrogenase maturation factor
VQIGEVAGEVAGEVTLASRIGALRIMDLPSGEQLPRIC